MCWKYLADGRLPSPRWRPVAWAAVTGGAVGMACVAVSDVNFSSNFPHLTDPVTIVPAASLARTASNLGQHTQRVGEAVRRSHHEHQGDRYNHSDSVLHWDKPYQSPA